MSNKSDIREFHQSAGAQFCRVGNEGLVEKYQNESVEYGYLTQTVGLLDFSARGRLCVCGDDRVRFLNGQVTNDVKILKDFEGCYAALVDAKAKMQSDLFLYQLPDEILLDMEPGYGPAVIKRLESHIIAEEVRVSDVSDLFGLLTIQGPLAEESLRALFSDLSFPDAPFQICVNESPQFGEVYIVNHARLGSSGFDCFLRTESVVDMAKAFKSPLEEQGGGYCGWRAFETVRIEKSIPRFGADLDESTLPPEAGLEKSAISYSKGCYFGQEVIARIRNYGKAARLLCGFEFDSSPEKLPEKGAQIILDGKVVGNLTSVVHSPAFKKTIAMGYLKKRFVEPNARFEILSDGLQNELKMVSLPFGS
jgi:folate-binding protein YgfZ